MKFERERLKKLAISNFNIFVEIFRGFSFESDLQNIKSKMIFVEVKGSFLSNFSR